MKVNKKLQATAYHEAGHVVANLELELSEFEYVTIIPNRKENSLGHVMPGNKGHLGNIIEKVRMGEFLSGDDELAFKNYLIKYLAGGAAQSKFNKQNKIPTGASSDLFEMEGMLSSYFGSEKISKAYFRYIYLETKFLVDKKDVWKAIKAIAEALLEKKTLTFEECKEIYYASNRDGFKSNYSNTDHR